MTDTNQPTYGKLWLNLDLSSILPKTQNLWGQVIPGKVWRAGQDLCIVALLLSFFGKVLWRNQEKKKENQLTDQPIQPQILSSVLEG